MDIENIQLDSNNETEKSNKQESSQENEQTIINEIEDNNNYQTKLIKLQNKIESKRIKKNEVIYISVPFLLKQNIVMKDQFTIFGCINVKVDDEIQFESQNQRSTVGHDSRKLLSISYNHEKNRVDCILEQQLKGKDDFQYLADLCMRKQSQAYKQLADQICLYQNTCQMIKAKFYKIIQMKKQDLNDMNYEYEQFVKYSFDIINKKDQNDIFRYCIGKMNYIRGDADIQYTGKSNSYFHLIGINHEIFQQLFLRGKQLSLKSQNYNNVDLSIQALFQRHQLNQFSNYISYEIKIIDGFPLKITEKVTKLASPFVQHQITPYDHICIIVDCEIDPQEIQRLIKYRERLVLENNLSSFDEYIQKLYESLQDVEYTILSEDFLQKFYPNQYKKQKK